MINQQLLDYIRQQLTTGVARDNIKTALLSQGWSDQDIAEGFLNIDKISVAPAVPSPTPVASQPTMPLQQTQILNEMPTPSSVRRFEWFMYASIAVGVATLLFRYSQFFTDSALVLSLVLSLLIPAFTIFANILCVWLTAYKKVNWTRWLLLVLLLTNIPSLFTIFIGFSAFNLAGSAPLIGIGALHLLQIALQIAALCFVFSKSANEWFALQQTAMSGSAGINQDNTVNTIWTKGIPKTNNVFMVISLLLVFGLDLLIIISSPDLRSFWYMMLGVLAVFAVFFCLENFVFRKKFTDNTSNLDKGIFVVVVIRNLIFLLNFIPFIQILGFVAIMNAGWIIGLIYLGLIIVRFNQLRRINP